MVEWFSRNNETYQRRLKKATVTKLEATYTTRFTQIGGKKQIFQ